MSVFNFIHSLNVIYSCDAKADFQHALLQSSEIILMCLRKEILLLTMLTKCTFS